MDVPQILLALAKPVAAKFGCGVIVEVAVNTKGERINWTVEIEKEARVATGPTFTHALTLATEDLPEASDDVRVLRERARALLARAHELEKGISA